MCALRFGFAPSSRRRTREQEGAAGGEQLYVVDGKILAQHEVEQHRVDALEADGAEADDGGHGIGGEERVGESEHSEPAHGGLCFKSQVALRTVTQVPSLPTSARATWKPFSGSSSSRL